MRELKRHKTLPLCMYCRKRKIVEYGMIVGCHKCKRRFKMNRNTRCISDSIDSGWEYYCNDCVKKKIFQNET